MRVKGETGMADETVLDRDTLQAWTGAILRAAGASAAAADATASTLVDASVRGLDSHGVVFLAFYLPRLDHGTTRGDAHPEVVINLPAFALVDGHDALGAYVSGFAMELCCEKAKVAGAAAVAVRNSSHFGAASCYAEQAVRHGCAGIVFSNSDPGMAPLGALAPVLGTNPLAIAAPGAPGMATPSLDIATSVVAQGKLILAQRAGESIPGNWAIGPDGGATTDPAAGLANSVLPMAGHKGFALAAMLDVLAGCLPGAGISPRIPGDPEADRPQNAGHLMIAIDVGAAGDGDAYAQSVRDLAAHVHGAPRAAGTEPFQLPGEREARTSLRRLREGIPLSASTTGVLRSLGSRYGVAFPA
jgi:LDH2 family malate/lactate/ureidoglycolate dehydrogenase